MEKIIIADIKCGESEGGFACGPCGGNWILELKLLRENGAEYYAGVVEVYGMPNFWLSETSRYQKEIDMDYEDGETFPEDYSFEELNEFYDAMDKLKKTDEALALALEYVAHLMVISKEELEAEKQAVIGKEIGTFEIPIHKVDEDEDEE